MEVQEHGEQESLFLIKSFKTFLRYGLAKVNLELQTGEVNRT